MTTLAISPDFTTPSAALAAAAALYLAVGEPLVGRRMYASLGRRRETQPGALVRYFRFTLGFWVLAAGLFGVVYACSPGIAAADLGLAGPTGTTGLGVGIAVLLGVVLGAHRLRGAARDGKHVPGLDEIAALLPRTRQERRYAAAVAVTDALCSELLYRGLLLAFGVGVLGLNLYVAAALALLIYAGAGLYQGRGGIAVFAAFGAVCTALYLSSGSLLLPVLAHAALSLRDLVYVPTVMKGRIA
ncbi:CPBP family glutamic-type intramembrane protease [Streptomyces sp. NPDC050095]|uniref:CPBP family glutamic-type intramembrane protease n=1 Tax=unclassified Streptomyces TaxID=2593676 RepID=UPI0034342FA8